MEVVQESMGQLNAMAALHDSGRYVEEDFTGFNCAQWRARGCRAVEEDYLDLEMTAAAIDATKAACVRCSFSRQDLCKPPPP
jgi:hypothetical protein